MIDVILIQSLGHSGSTILERALASTPGVAGLGEVDRTIADYRRSGFAGLERTCTCGQDAFSCPVWSMLSQIQACDHPAEDLLKTIRIAAKATDSTVLVDSSKRNAQARRYAELDSAGELRVHLVVLVRDYRSWCTTRKFREIAGETAAWAYIRRSWRWLSYHLPLISRLGSLGFDPKIVLYEDFAQYPGRIMSEIFQGVRLSAEDVPEDPDLSMANQHLLRGNGLSRSSAGNTRVCYEPSWKSDWRTRWLLPLVFGPELYRRYVRRRHGI